MANDQAEVNEMTEEAYPNPTFKQKLIDWLKNRFQVAKRIPSKNNQAAMAIFYVGLCIEMALTIPGIPTGIGVWFDYLVFGIGYLFAAAAVYCAVMFLVSFFYLRVVAGWLTGSVAIVLQSYIILQKSNWGWKAASEMTAIILAILLIVSLLVSYLYAYKEKSVSSIMMMLATLLLLVVVGLAGKAYWNKVQHQAYLAQYADLLLQEDSEQGKADDAKSSSDDAALDDSAPPKSDDASDRGEGAVIPTDNELNRDFKLKGLEENLSEPGEYRFNHYVYNANEAWRDDEDEATIYTTPTDGSTLLKDWSWTKEFVWGFTEQEIPMKGQLWVPEGEGPFPIVFIMHGNHVSEEDSSDGYSYLGELLASHGMIVSSIDANFLNYSVWSGIVDDDQLLRSWLMLAHIDKLYEEVSEQLHIDWDNVALIGHSRGGQAASMAVDAKKWIADEPVVEILDKINIKAVIAIAPTDYMVDNKLANLRDVNYLTLHGTMDSDLTESFGERQYERTKFTEVGHFKATVELYHANHGQFNTVWGKYDEQLPGALVLNTAELMSGEDQRLAAKLFIHSFLQASFFGNTRYEAVFQDFRTIGEYLPLTGYVSRYYSSNTKLWYDFEVAGQEGQLVKSDPDMIVKSIDLKGRSGGDKKNRVLAVTWHQPDSVLQFPLTAKSAASPQTRIGALVVSLARAESLYLNEQEESEEEASSEDTNDANKANNHNSDDQDNNGANAGASSDETEGTEEMSSSSAEEAQKQKEPYTGLQLKLELKAKQWGTEVIDLEPYFHILQPAAHDFTKIKWLEQRIKKGKYDVEIEPLLQTYVIPINIIEQQHPRDGSLFATDMESLSFIFKGDQGSVIVDAIGYITEGGTYVEYRR